MGRDVSGVYTKPFPDVVTATAISSTVENGTINDLVTDANTPRPIVAGGTGGNSAATARANLLAATYGQQVPNFDSFSFLPGFFYADSSASNAPVGGHAFAGVCDFVDANNMFLEAYDRDDAAQPGALWIRQKKAGVWSSWVKAQALNVIGTPSANQFTTWQSSTAIQGVAITGLVKGNGASAPTAAAANADYLPATSPVVTNSGATSQIVIKADAGQAAVLAYQEGATLKWQLVKQASNQLYIYDAVNAVAPLQIDASAKTFALGASGYTISSLTPAVDNNTTTIATTAYVVGQAGSATPLADGTAAVGTSLRYARSDHVHPQTGVATVKINKFTTSGTYTPSTGMLFCIIECWGAGGGGGGTASASTNVGAGGGGGGAGSKARLLATAADIGASKTVTIGAKGTGGATGNNAGTAGGDTSVGVLCIGKGGSGGAGNPANSATVVAAAGSGGVTGTGDITGTGQSGGLGITISGGNYIGAGGVGGSSEVGSCSITTPTTSATNGAAASGFAAGGGGGQSYNGGGTSAGGNGADGLVVIIEFCSQ